MSEPSPPLTNHLLILSCLFVTCLLIANTISVKVMNVGGLYLPAGIFIYPCVSVLGDVITEVYGYRATRRIIWVGFLALLLQNVGYSLARFAPPAEFWPHQAAFDTVLGTSLRIALASLAAYPVGEFVNAVVLAKLKLRQEHRGMSLRFLASTLLGQAADSLLFITLAFAGTMPVYALLSMMVTSWTLKVAWELLALPVSTAAARHIKRVSHTDVVDANINFSPWRL